MPTVVYLHPLRTISVEWEAGSDGIPTITSYSEQLPEESAKPAEGSTTIAHGNDVIMHRYPDDDMDDDRRSFELQSFLPEVDVDAARVVTLYGKGLAYDHRWTTLLCHDVGTLTDIECDMTAMALDGDTLFLGRRGRWWWFGGVRTDGTVVHLDRFPHGAPETLSLTIQESIEETASIGGPTLRRLIVFGDVVTPSLLKEVATITRGRFDLVDRSNPFRHVRAEISVEHQQNLLRRAHLLGALVGPMFRTS